MLMEAGLDLTGLDHSPVTPPPLRADFQWEPARRAAHTEITLSRHGATQIKLN